MKVYGYTRVSTRKQITDRQVKAITAFCPDAVIISETFTGTKINRPEWQKLKTRVLREKANGDDITIIFDSVSRMSRNVSEGVSEYFELYNAGIELVFLNERHIDTATYKQALAIQLDRINTGDQDADNLFSDIMNAIQRYQVALATKQIQLAFEQSEKEVTDLQKRTKAGMAAKGAGEKIAAARTGKKYASKKSIKAKEVILKHSLDFGGTLQDKDVAALAHISRNTFYKYKAEIWETLKNRK